MTTTARLGTGQRPGVLVVLLLGSTLSVMAGAILGPVIEVLRADLAVTGTAAGLVLTAHSLAIALASPLVGWVMDRWGVRRPLVVGLLVYGLAGGAGLVVESYTQLLVTRLVFGLGAAAVFTGTTVAVLMLYQGTARDRVVGWRSTAVSMGGVLWPLIGGAAGAVSWHGPFAVYLVGVPIAIATLVVLPEVPAPARGGGGGGLVSLLRVPRLMAYCGLLLVLAMLMLVVAVFLPQRLAQVGVHNPFVVSVFSAVLAVAMSLVGLGYARIRGRLRYPAMLRVAVVGWSAGFLCLGLTDSPPLILLAVIVFGLGMGLAMPALTVLIADAAPPAARAQAASLTGTATFAGQFAAPLLFGPLMEATSIRAGFLSAAGLSVILVVGLLFLPAEARQVEVAGEPAEAASATPRGAASGEVGS
ncbi:MFS transporter [Actinoalloteichus caeruleus]|uniref:MFS transporter n=1 Tax=Actinoalloteichus cyanogriseus TaxID=2893586 RepID=UPI0009DCEA77|nr:MFS transporter [Actinoalloteichus caeruleus]